MAEYVLSERAKKDILDIANYTERHWSEEQAEKYVRMIFNECRELANIPLAGRSYDEYGPGLHGHPCGKHVIFYRVLSCCPSLRSVSFVSYTRRWIFPDIFRVI